MIQTAASDPLRYSLVIQPDSLAFVFVWDQARRVQLDYGACAFNAEGNFLSYRHTSAEEVLSPQEYARDHAVGFATLVDLPRQGDPALVRFVARDRETGNLGTIDVTTAVAGAMEPTRSQTPKSVKRYGVNQVLSFKALLSDDPLTQLLRLFS